MFRRIATPLAIAIALAGAVVGGIVAVTPAAAIPPQCMPYPANCSEPRPELITTERQRSVENLANGCTREILTGQVEGADPPEVLLTIAVTVDYCILPDRINVFGLDNIITQRVSKTGFAVAGSPFNSKSDNFTNNVIINSSRRFDLGVSKTFKYRLGLSGSVTRDGVQAEFETVSLP